MRKDSEPTKDRAVTNLFSPRYWVVWSLFGLAHLVVWLPLRWQYAVGKFLGRLAFKRNSRRKRIINRNLELAYPSMATQEREAISSECMDSISMTLVETFFVWLRGVTPLVSKVKITGLDRLNETADQGAIVLGGHFAALDLCVTALAARTPLGATYRKFKHPVVEYFAKRSRERCYAQLHEATHLKAIVCELERGSAIWFAADQDMGNRKSTCFVPFFNIETSTSITPYRLARRTGAKMLFVSHARNASNLTWEIQVQEVESSNEPEPTCYEIEATRVNSLIESAINRHPAQYFWVHRRFKSTKSGRRRPYD